jgi:hypothetical protein
MHGHPNIKRHYILRGYTEFFQYGQAELASKKWCASYFLNDITFSLIKDIILKTNHNTQAESLDTRYGLSCDLQ